MKKIALISTGGTIASKVDDKTGKFMAGEQTGEELLSNCNLRNNILGSNIQVVVRSVYQVPSNQMSFEKNLKIYNVMKQMAQEENCEGFIVTHGTDTLEESAYFLSLLWDLDIPLVFTGSQISPTENNTDAFHNITNALLVASSDDSWGMGVLVSFNDRIFTAKYATKIHASNINGFGSPRNGPVGIVDGEHVHYFYRPTSNKYYHIKDELPKVEIVKEYMDIDESIIDYYVSRGVSGLIIEGFGRGNITLGSAARIKSAIEKGVVVVITTTCSDGEVAPVYGYKGGLNDLLMMGAISGHDYTSKKARIKLMVLLASGIDKNDIQIEFDKY